MDVYQLGLSNGFKQGEQSRPPIDVSRFHEGPMTEEQIKENAYKTMLFVVQGSKRIHVGYVSTNGAICISIYCDNEDIVSWYPLPEVTS